jgi:phosphate transport system substrate-binding protein
MLLVVGACLLSGLPVDARDRIRIVGSQEVMPVIETVAQTFSVNAGKAAPVLETTGSGNGFRLFCEGIGFAYPDMIATPRPITAAELASCQKKGVVAISEIMIGHDAIAVVNSRAARQYNFTPATLFSALAASVETDGEIAKNPHLKWTDIDPSLPDEAIKVMGPPAASGLYDDFVYLIMERGCGEFSKISTLEATKRYDVCHSLRTDDGFTQGPRNETALLDWVVDNPAAFAIAGYSFLTQNQDLVAANAIENVIPTAESISSGAYPFTRPIYVYVKIKHVAAVEGLQDFLYELTSDHTIGPDGYLMAKSQAGFFPLDDRGRNQARNMAISLAPLTR